MGSGKCRRRSRRHFPLPLSLPNESHSERSEESPWNLKKDVDFTIYEEDIYVGYRYYDTFGKPVSYPFGYGLSYTNFEYSNATVKEEKGVYTVEVDVKNIGNISGKEVVQLYVTAPENPSYSKPKKELKAFSKTKELKPNENQIITMKISAADLASFDENSSAWLADRGMYKFHLGKSSNEIFATLETTLTKEIKIKTNNVLLLQEPVNTLKK